MFIVAAVNQSINQPKSSSSESSPSSSSQFLALAFFFLAFALLFFFLVSSSLSDPDSCGHYVSTGMCCMFATKSRAEWEGESDSARSSASEQRQPLRRDEAGRVPPTRSISSPA